eukprot:TRINITY_DN6514_c0_g4_i1.p1 TRINITY_DN6514_c0_g4~~TRINITY_DN6514_c0_g4_i1.p1  ORF type:complete len:718 (+),score=242.61 TRINITY_DN6514_c0_g4_i1:87-2156(+)
MEDTEGAVLGAVEKYANLTCLERNAELAAQEEKELEVEAYVMLVQGCMIASAFLAVKLVRKYDIPLMTECASVILTGFVFGGVLNFVKPSFGKAAAMFNAQSFLLMILPPIIFDAGFSLTSNGNSISANTGTILMLAIVGTIVSTFIVGTSLYAVGGAVGAELELWESYAFGALISAVDPVATLAVLSEVFPGAKPGMFYLVFGESVINDAVAIVLYTVCAGVLKSQREAEAGMATGASNSIASSFAVFLQFWGVFLGSILVGVLVTAATAFFLKVVDMRTLETIELVTVVTGAMGTYAVAEAFELSGIMAIFVAGRLMKHWVLRNASLGTRMFLPRISHAVAETAELYVFAFLGSAFWAYQECLTWNWPFIGFTFVVILVGRAANVFPLCWLSNLFRSASAKKITMAEQTFMWFSGLRGAIAFALACYGTNDGTLRGGDLLVTTTLVLVMLTVFIFGGLGKPLLMYLGLAPAANLPRDLGAEVSDRSLRAEEAATVEPLVLSPVESGVNQALDSDLDEQVGAAYGPPPMIDPEGALGGSRLYGCWKKLRLMMWRSSSFLLELDTKVIQPLICRPSTRIERRREKLALKLLKEGVDHEPFIDTLSKQTLQHIAPSPLFDTSVNPIVGAGPSPVVQPSPGADRANGSLPSQDAAGGEDASRQSVVPESPESPGVDGARRQGSHSPRPTDV